jgi:ubiquinone/menaquinone biosynthesis C-methylase UbiE
MESGAGDKTERWRESYSRVRKDPLSDPQATNRSRLMLLGVCSLPRSSALLDVGTGDGNLFKTLEDLGFTRLWALEYQPELLNSHPKRDRVVVASATHIPYATGSMEAVIVMDVLHHLTREQLPSCLNEIRRVLRPEGFLYVCEPADTLARRVLTLFLMSPLSRLTRFSRDKRAMVEQERNTLEPWLDGEKTVSLRIQHHGFRLEFFRRCWLHHYGRFRVIC